MSRGTTSKLPPLLLAGLIFAIFPTVLTLKFGPLLDPDVYDYVGFWRKLLHGFPHTDRDDALPKALPVLLNGALYSATHSFHVLSAMSIMAGSAAVAILSRCVARVAGNGAGWMALALLACLPSLVRQTTEGGSDVLELLFIALALWEFGRGERRWVRIGVFALLAGLCRPELWPLFAVGGLVSLWMLRRDPRIALALMIPCAAPVLWMAFDALLTGDFFFAFHNTSTYTERAESVVARVSLLKAVPAYAWEVVRIVLLMTPGIGIGLGVWGSLRLARTAPHLCLCFLAIGLSVTVMYFPPFLQSIPVHKRFLVVPVALLTAVAGLALAELWNVLARDTARGRSRFWRILFLAATLLPLLQGVAHYARHTAPQISEYVRELDVALNWIEEVDPEAAERRYFCTPRRRYQIVMHLDCPSDNVLHHRRFEPETFADEAAGALDYILVDPRDANSDLRALWSSVEFPPPGFESLDLPDSVRNLSGYRRSPR